MVCSDKIFQFSTSATRLQFTAPPPFLRESADGGEGLRRDEGMTAAIIKNVLLCRYLEASPQPTPPSFPSNNSLVTPLHCEKPRLLTRRRHWQEERNEGSQHFNLAQAI